MTITTAKDGKPLFPGYTNFKTVDDFTQVGEGWDILAISTNQRVDLSQEAVGSHPAYDNNGCNYGPGAIFGDVGHVVGHTQFLLGEREITRAERLQQELYGAEHEKCQLENELSEANKNLDDAAEDMRNAQSRIKKIGAEWDDMKKRRESSEHSQEHLIVDISKLRAHFGRKACDEVLKDA